MHKLAPATGSQRCDGHTRSTSRRNDGGRGVEAATLRAALAWRLSPTDETRKALQRIDEDTNDVARVWQRHTGTVRMLAFNRDGSELLSASTDGLVLRWWLNTGQATGTPLLAERMEPQRLVVSRDGTDVLLSGRRDGNAPPVVALFRLADGTRRPLGLVLSRDVAEPACAAVSVSAPRVAVGGRGAVEVREVDTATSRSYPVPAGGNVAAERYTLRVPSGMPLAGIVATRVSFIRVQMQRELRRVRGRAVQMHCSVARHADGRVEEHSKKQLTQHEMMHKGAAQPGGQSMRMLRLTHSPPFARFSSAMRPPCASAISRASARPRPVPARLVE